MRETRQEAGMTISPPPGSADPAPKVGAEEAKVGHLGRQMG